MKNFTTRLTLNGRKDEFVLRGAADGLCVASLNQYWDIGQVDHGGVKADTVIVEVTNKPTPNSIEVEFSEGNVDVVDNGETHYLLNAVRDVLNRHNVRPYATYYVSLWAVT